MKILAHIAFRGVLLALLALSFSTLRGHAQTLLQVEETGPMQANVKLAKLVAEAPEAVARDDSSSNVSPQVDLLHVSDRAQRGRVDPTEAGVQTVLPDLRDAAPEPSQNKIAKDARRLHSSE